MPLCGNIPAMPVRFLLGPAGSGKTRRCLDDIRAVLRAAPGGLPLVLLAPKQATFQLERQLLAGADGAGDIAGFTRLHIFSFDKLARFILDQLHVAPPRLLAGEGRVMVLRALLHEHEADLQLFSRSARRPGFAAELGRQLSELQRQQITAARLRELAGDARLRPELRSKLSDLARLQELYARWLAEHDLRDADDLPDFATAQLRAAAPKAPLKAPLKIHRLWLDGFAEMTPQELDLLAEVVPHCDDATLAFCLENAAESPRLSIWSAIGQTFQHCRARLEHRPGAKIEIEPLPRAPQKNRFAACSELAQLEKSWAGRESGVRSQESEAGILAPNAQRLAPAPPSPTPIRCFVCDTPEAEAALAAREILKFVRAGNRFRDCAVLVRSLETHHAALTRALRRYEIPFFLDRRADVTHHPLAELTRGALRTLAFDWPHDDWFATLKAGFAPVPETEIDRLENAALEFGWRGKKWREPLPDSALETLRRRLVPPFENCRRQLAQSDLCPTGEQLAAALRELWRELDVARTLEAWSTAEAESVPPALRHPSLHATVWEQMNGWLDNLALAFPRKPLPLRDWLPVLEAGLAGLTVGVIPPALDQVLIGAVDRARNPDLKLALILGLNEGVFPAPPPAPVILTQSDRDELDARRQVVLGADFFTQVARERYLGYIACTRAGERLIVTFARQSAAGKTLNRSPLLAHLQTLFPALAIEEFSGEPPDFAAAEHASELMPLLARALDRRDACPTTSSRSSLPSRSSRDTAFLPAIPALQALAEKLSQLREPDERENLSPAQAEALYGTELHTSVTRLEEFAQCPFKFFIRFGLHAGERKKFELDDRQRGNFQHGILKTFHTELQAEGKRWRDLTSAEARDRIGRIAARLAGDFHHGLLRDTAAADFAARALTAALQDFIAVIVDWMRGQYDFDPAQVELGFGGQDDAAPPWKIPLPKLSTGQTLALQGRIDRVDVWRDPDGGAAEAVVMDYKSGNKKPDTVLMENGVQLQLLAYLAALRHWPQPREIFGADSLRPAGAFYVNLRGQHESSGSREEVLAEADTARREAYRHHGRFDTDALPHLSRTDASDQFSFKRNKDGSVSKGSREALSHADFLALLDGVEAQLREIGAAIFSGAAAVDPYRKGKQTPCEYCDYPAACRIDPWRHEWREISKVKMKNGEKCSVSSVQCSGNQCAAFLSEHLKLDT